MLQLIYYSRSLLPEGRERLEKMREILKQAQVNNERDELTGFLLFDRRWFVQVLEGDSGRVETTYNRIQTDARHTDLKLVSRRATANRAFPAWSMCASIRTEANEEIFLRHGIGGELSPAALSQPSILALAMDLQDLDRARHARAVAHAARPSLEL